jgi:hypothetical protein
VDTVQPLHTFNLIYHLAPFAGTDVWRKNVRQLLRRWDQFNGKKIIAISVGNGLAEGPEVRNLFEGRGAEFINVANDVRLRERASFFYLLERVESRDPGEATFYAHAKGVTTVGNTLGVMYWRNLMYASLLDQPERVRQMLRQFPVVGSFRKRQNVVYPDGVTKSPWHFSGTFFWFRHDAWFSRPWRTLPITGWSVEAAPGLLFKYEESCCVAKDEPGDPYNPRIYLDHERLEDDGGAGVPVGLKVEIGGGKKPHGGGYVNVDRDPCADVQFDFETLATGAKLPFDDDSVSALYSSHAIEHVVALVPLMREIVRICRVGAYVEIRVPHYFNNMAMCPDHKHVIGHEQIEHWTTTALDYWWADSKKRLQLLDHHTVPGRNFARWKKMLPHASDRDILDLCPDAAHENHWIFNVIQR